MTATIKPAATSKQEVREPSRELSVDELALVAGGKAGNAKTGATYLVFTFKMVAV
ncbi:MAG TPA: hypothetical protein VH678_25320 [Xanthobacteraceae bacterium]